MKLDVFSWQGGELRDPTAYSIHIYSLYSRCFIWMHIIVPPKQTKWTPRPLSSVCLPLEKVSECCAGTGTSLHSEISGLSSHSCTAFFWDYSSIFNTIQTFEADCIAGRPTSSCNDPELPHRQVTDGEDGKKVLLSSQWATGTTQGFLNSFLLSTYDCASDQDNNVIKYTDGKKPQRPE